VSTENWRAEAENWMRWARKPNLDGYWAYHSAFYDDFGPRTSKRSLDIGCGEGRTTRDLASRGHHVTAIDASETLVHYARDADPKNNYIVADAAHLPFRDEVFDVAVSYNSLMDVDDMPGSVRETARVLRRHGYLCVCVTHPLADAGKFSHRSSEAPFIIEGSYLEQRPFYETVERGGLVMTFSGRCYPLQDYMSAFEAAGFLMERLREPTPAESFIDSDPAEGRWARIPNFLFMRLVNR
jgi:SAM-dependent methyltransferase